MKRDGRKGAQGRGRNEVRKGGKQVGVRVLHFPSYYWLIYARDSWDNGKEKVVSLRQHPVMNSSVQFCQYFVQIWPDLIRPREMQHLDQSGIDLLVWSDDQPFPCVVQCKGFYQHDELGDAQLHQITKSIEAFRQSPFRCREYVLVHNRQGENRAIHQEITKQLQGLEQIGKAERAYVWDRQVLLRNAKQGLLRLLIDALSNQSQSLLETQRQFFVFGDVYLEEVPMLSYRWKAKRNFKPELSIEGSVRRTRMSRVIDKAKKARWLLLNGSFGSGKTTAALRAAVKKDAHVIYVRSRDLPNDYGSMGTSYLAQNIVRSLDTFAEFDEQTRGAREAFRANLESSFEESG